MQINLNFDTYTKKQHLMKSRLTLLFLLIASITYAQDSYYSNQTQVGVGIGGNLVSVVGEDIKPTEISMRFRIHRHHTVQLFIPIYKQSESFKSNEISQVGLINTSVSTKKSLYGVGLDYDYALHTYSLLDFIVGLRAEFQLQKYRTDLTNKHPVTNNYINQELTHSEKKTSNYLISPNAGLRLNLGNLALDAKFLLTMLSKNGDTDGTIERRRGEQSNISSTTTEFSDKISNKFKLKPGVAFSVSFYL